MTCRVVITEEDERELAEAVDFYDEREPGTGQRFAREVRDIFRKVFHDPERLPRASRLTQKAKILGWPHSVYFTSRVETGELIIVSVWHGKRNPAELGRRLK